MADQQGGGIVAGGEPPAGVVVAVAVATSATLAWLLVYLAVLPFPWLPAAWIAVIVLVAPLLAGAFAAAAGRSSSAGAVSGMLVGVALLLTMGAFAAAGEGGGDPAAREPMLRSALAAVVLAGVLGATAASALRGASARLAGGGPTLEGPTLESWELRLQGVATLSCAIALIWRGPRLAGAGGAAEDAGVAAALVDRWSGAAFGALGRAGGASLWPAPVLWTLLVASTLLAVRFATRRNPRAGRGDGLRVRAGPAPLLPAIVAVLLALAWLLAEITLARPWSGVAGTLCGGSQVVALAASSPLGARAERSGFARLVVAAIVALLVVQLTLGGAQRDQPAWLWIHVLFGVAVLLPVALHFGVRGWLLGAAGVDRRLALLVAGGVTLQVVVGVGALLTPPASPWLDWLLATLHLWIAVGLLAAVSRLAARARLLSR